MAESKTYRETATKNIRLLSDLSTRLPSILTAAATTVSQLTNAPIRPSSTAPDTPAARRAALAASSKEYLTTVVELGQALVAQVKLLEEHGVIPAEEVRYRAPDQSSAAGSGPTHPNSEATITNGGLGEFDVGILNARAGIHQRDGDEILERIKSILKDMAVQTEEENSEMAIDG